MVTFLASLLFKMKLLAAGNGIFNKNFHVEMYYPSNVKHNIGEIYFSAKYFVWNGEECNKVSSLPFALRTFILILKTPVVWNTWARYSCKPSFKCVQPTVQYL